MTVSEHAGTITTQSECSQIAVVIAIESTSEVRENRAVVLITDRRRAVVATSRRVSSRVRRESVGTRYLSLIVVVAHFMTEHSIDRVLAKGVGISKDITP